MVKNTYYNTLNYEFNPQHKGAPYTVDGVHFMNAGEFTEIVLKACKGFKPEKDKNTRFDQGSDIQETNTSVKSSGATLTSAKLGMDFDFIIKAFFKKTASSNFSYVTIIDNVVNEYNMSAQEFESFIRAWGSYQKDRQVIRFKKTSGKMIKWLEERV